MQTLPDKTNDHSGRRGDETDGTKRKKGRERETMQASRQWQVTEQGVGLLQMRIVILLKRPGKYDHRSEKLISLCAAYLES